MLRRLLIALLGCLCFTVSVSIPLAWGGTSVSSYFKDLKGSYAVQEIDALAKQRIIQGTAKGMFQPDLKVTRAEFITMMSRMLQLEPVEAEVASFRDVPTSAWYYGWVQAGSILGIVKGTSSDRFSPGGAITREEAAVIAARAYHKEMGDDTTRAPYSDARSIASWADDAVKAAAIEGWIKGDQGTGKFRPKDPMTREETAVLLYRILQLEPRSSAWKGSKDIQLGWQYGSTTAAYIEQVKQSNINTLVPRWFYIKSNQVLSSSVDPALITWAHQNNKQVWAMLGNQSDSNVTHEMVSSYANRTKIIDELSRYVRTYAIDGINVDFENVNGTDRNSLTLFIKELSNAMNRLGVVVSVDVSPDLGTSWTAAFDYEALGRYADYLVLMGYDEHWAGAPQAGSTSSLPWLEKGLDRMLEAVPAEKIIVAMPFYTRDWVLTTLSSQLISLQEQRDVLNANKVSYRWDNSVSQYVADYIQLGRKHRVWLEDSRSLTAKHQMAAERQVAGFAYWWMGAETQDVWSSLRNSERYLQ